MKYLLLLALLAGVWWAWSKRAAAREAAEPARKDRSPEKMVMCAHCGVHLPESEALLEAGEPYCSPAHRAAGKTER